MDRSAVSQVTYEADLVLWLEQQAQLLRAGKFDELDVDHIIEELEATVRADRRELAAHLEHIVAYLLSLQVRPLRKAHYWRCKLADARFGMELLIDDSPSLVSEVAELAARRYGKARRRAVWETRLPESVFPAELPYSTAQLLDDEFDQSCLSDQGL
ncbi:MAG TPA: DUF29 domain-containing protein [Telluria sp.]|jgi:hypothetical protein